MENETYDVFDAKEKSIENLLYEYAIFPSMKDISTWVLQSN